MKLTPEERAELPENMLKYYNYREQMGRLKKALNAEFYLEAIFIEYAIMEDRLQSVLETAGVFHPEKHKNIGKKISRLKEMVRNPKNSVSRYISFSLMEDVHNWKEKTQHACSCIHETESCNVRT